MKNFKLAIIPLLLAGCGGGGGSDNTPVAVEQQSTPVAPPQTPPQSTVKPPTAPQAGQGNAPIPAPPANTPTAPQNPDVGSNDSGTPVRPEPVEEPAEEPDGPPPGVVIPTPTPPANEPPAQPQPVRYTADNPDESGPNVHVVYLKPAGNINDRQLDTNGTLDRAAQSINNWLASKTPYQIRWDVYVGQLDVTHMTLENGDVYYDQFGRFKRDAIEQELIARNAVNPNKRYLVYYEGSHPLGSCGDSAVNSGGNERWPGIVSIVYLRGVQGRCYGSGFAGTQFGYIESVSLHELLHNLGVEHSDDPNDIMFRHWLDPRVERTINPNWVLPFVNYR